MSLPSTTHPGSDHRSCRLRSQDLRTRREIRGILLRQTSVIFDQLRGILDALLEGQRIPIASLQNLASRVLAESDDLSDKIVLVPESGSDSVAFLPDCEQDSVRHVCAGAIQTARLLAGFVRKSPRWEAHAELVVIATFLNDVGLLALESAFGTDFHRLATEKPTTFSNHPCISAAIASHVSNAPIQLGLLIRKHHECLDGTGFPAHLTGRDLDEPARLLGLAVRFTRLLDAYASADVGTVSETDSRTRLLQNAAWQLRQDARVGELDLSLVSEFLKHLDPELPDILDSQTFECCEQPQALEEDRRLRFDTLHTESAGGHTGLSAGNRRSSRRRNYRKQQLYSASSRTR